MEQWVDVALHASFNIGVKLVGAFILVNWWYCLCDFQISMLFKSVCMYRVKFLKIYNKNSRLTSNKLSLCHRIVTNFYEIPVF